MMRAWMPVIALLVVACTPVRDLTSKEGALEDIYVLRSIREPSAPAPDACPTSKTGFDPLPADAARSFSFWSIDTSPGEGRIVDARVRHVAALRGCIGPTAERTRQNFFVEIDLNGRSFSGSGECQALMIDFPEPRMFPVRCQVVLSHLPPPYVGGLLTTNTLTSAAAFGGDTEPPGYTQASIATIRLWRKRT